MTGALRERISAAIAAIGCAWVAAVGLRIYLADGSYFHGEACVVLSLDGLDVLETFRGRLLGGGQNFPRFYLLAIRFVRTLLGEYTLATRLLPQLFFLAATVLWARLLFLRFRARPGVLLLGIVLLGASVTWPIYGAAVKQYTFDVFLALALFSVPDRVLDTALREGLRRGRLLALVVPVALSYTYGVVLLARLLGWLAYGARRQGLRLDVGSTALLVAGFAAANGLLFATDLRHTAGAAGLFEFWNSCILPAPPGESLALLDRFWFGWYEGHVEFMRRTYLPVAVRVALLLAIAVGVARIVSSVVFRPDVPDGAAAEDRFGSRSAGCLAGVVGVIATSFVLGYPICSGRLLLYVLWFQQMLMLEGVDQLLASAGRVGRQGGGVRRTSIAIASVSLAALIAVMTGTALQADRDLLARVPIEDVRSQLGRLQTAPDLPVVVTPCMDYQIRTLPEGLDMEHVILQPFVGPYLPMPLGEEVWIIHSRLFGGWCQGVSEQFAAITSDSPRGQALRGAEVEVYRTRLLTPDEMRSKKERDHREAVERKRERRRGNAPTDLTTKLLR